MGWAENEFKIGINILKNLKENMNMIRRKKGNLFKKWANATSWDER